MDIPTDQLLLKRAIAVKAVVTPRWKEEAQQQLQTQINQLDGQLQQLELRVKQMMNELRKQNIQIVGAEGNAPSNTEAQMQNLQAQANAQKSELLEQKSQILKQIDQVQNFEMETEVEQGQIENFFHVKKGDNLVQKMQVEILIRDGVIEDIRGLL
ncbi:YlqD family protein [Lyngbya confervoides]|uniref:YlqD family protein n=1 Tax=Lyngbya confervoides BDU141951 TaxID=1574623 RepID=A0ABD4T8D3_9CYAN|nr:YlqD family protein [Lyngbya confervoides]MCM1984886.1 YlqD family protein [Lyngbya confervoides BDU141951]